MKKSTFLKLTFLAGVFGVATAHAQVVNFQQSYNYPEVPGYAVLYSGQGVYSDPGNNVWNGFGAPNGPGSTWFYGNGNHWNAAVAPAVSSNPGNPYAAFGGLPGTLTTTHGTTVIGIAGGQINAGGTPTGTPAGNSTSAGAFTPVTLGITYGFNNGHAPAATQGSPAWLLSQAAVVNGANPGVGTADNPLGSLTLSNVAAGTYDLYLYGANSDGTRGATFVPSSGTPSNGVYFTMNPYPGPGSGPLTSFGLGINYVVYNNVSPAGDGTINVLWGAVSNVNSTLTGEGDFCGLQLVPSVPVPAPPTIIQEPRSAIYTQGATATLVSVGRGNPAVAYQWYEGTPPGTPVAGQTSATLTFPNAQAAQSGNYFVVVTNVSGAATSSVVTLTIAAAPFITGQSSTNGLQLISGQNHFAMSVNVVGIAPFYYFWRANGVTVAVTTNSGSIGFTNITATANYDCLVSNSFGTAVSSPLPVTIVTAPNSSYAVALLALIPVDYWPLTDLNGSVAYDYIGGNNGAIGAGVTVGLPGPGTGFGSTSYAYSFSGASSFIDIPGGPVNLTGPKSFILWINDTSVGNGFFTIAGKGDSSYRFDVDPGGIGHYADGTGGDAIGGPVIHDPSNWHQMVGTFDTTGTTNVYLYIDGVRVATQPAGGQPGSTHDLYIGGAPDYTDRYFSGSIAQVALFNYTLSAAQVQNLYNAARTAPFIITEPTNFTGNAGGYITNRVVANGAPPLSYQWSGPGGVIAGATSSILVVSNLNQTGVPPNSGPGDYFCTVTNPYGSTNSNPGTLTVLEGPPSIMVDVTPLSLALPVGVPASYSIQVGGSAPFHYQWYANGAPVSGATSASYTFTTPAGSNYYYCVVTNSIGSATSSSAGLVGITTPPPVVTFNGDGTGWTANGNVAIAGVTNGTLLLTDGVNSRAESFFLNTLEYIGGFVTYFTYQATGSGSLADGTTFCIQNSLGGFTAVGQGGGDLGFYGIQPSAAFELNVYNGAMGGSGLQFGLNGSTADSPNPTAPYFSCSPVNLDSQDAIKVRLYYSNGKLNVLLVDLTTSATFSTTLNVGDLTQVVQNDTAFVGFTAATGGLNSIQTVSGFQYTYTTPPVLSLAKVGGNAVISWPVTVSAFFTLQQSPTLSGPWTSAGAPTIVGLQNQVTVPATGVAHFYRLVLQ